MRLFIGIEPSPLMRDALDAASRTVRDNDPKWLEDKWVPAANLHLTVKFLGDMPADTAEFLLEDLGTAVADLAPFELELVRAVHPVPDRTRATMLWSTFADVSGQGASLISRVEDFTSVAYGVVPDSRGFNPHVTLVRARSPRTLHTADIAEEAARQILAGETSMSVRAVTLFRSTLTRTRPVYESLGSVELGG